MSPCQTFRFSDGGVAVVCSRGRRRRPKRCELCGNESAVLCDGKLEGGRTCDVSLCRRCAVHVGTDRDYCPAHAPQRSLLP